MGTAEKFIVRSKKNSTGASKIVALAENEKHVLDSRKHLLPTTHEGREALGHRELRVPATWEEFLKFSAISEYNVQYREGQIISFIEIDEQTNCIMGQASLPHEMLVGRFITRLSNLLDDIHNDYLVLGSNAKIFIAPDRGGFNADVTVVKGTPKLLKYKVNKRSYDGVTNPWLVVEVLSTSTRRFDLTEKLGDYQKIESLQQMIFVEQDSINIKTYIRQGNNPWLFIELKDIKDELPIFEKDETISLSDIYQTLNLKR